MVEHEPSKLDTRVRFSPPALASLDRLVVMDKGRIVDQGSHQELVSRGGLYARLWARQSGGFLGFDPEDKPRIPVL